jgi:F-type H+-transporting ATPase subunit gamma
MAGTKKIVSRIKSAKNISQITKAMQMVSASKMKKAQDLAMSGQPYSEELRRVLLALLSTSSEFEHHLLTPNTETSKMLCVYVTTNKGLCGGLNTNHFRSINTWRKNKEIDFITIGKKGRLFVTAIGGNVIADYSNIPDIIDFAHIIPIAQQVIELFKQKQYQRVYLSYNHFVSTLSQKPKLLQLLPIEPDKLEESLGLLERLTEEEERKFEPKEYILEPNPRQIINWLLPYFIELQLYHFLIENKASEHSARMVAMKGASENAKEVMTQLRLVYNRIRQQQVTAEIADIVTASLSVE